VFHPARLGIYLPMLLLMAGHNFSIMVEKNKPAARGALINGSYIPVIAHAIVSLTCIIPVFIVNRDGYISNRKIAATAIPHVD
jgi:hypothetical protein